MRGVVARRPSARNKSPYGSPLTLTLGQTLSLTLSPSLALTPSLSLRPTQSLPRALPLPSGRRRA